MSETDDEEQIAARTLGDLLTSAMMRAYEETPEPRRWLYCWERDALQWLIRFKQRRPDARMSSDWIATFIDLNREAIESPSGAMDFNLRAARLAKEAESNA